MANNIERQLNDKLFRLLQRECFLLLHTNDYQTNSPQVNAISWVYAPSRKTIRFAIVNHSKVVQNILEMQQICLTLIDDESTYAIYGEAKILTNETKDVPVKIAIIEVKIVEIRDVMFYGSKISQNPSYKKIYDKEAATKLDLQVMERLKHPLD